METDQEQPFLFEKLEELNGDISTQSVVTIQPNPINFMGLDS